MVNKIIREIRSLGKLIACPRDCYDTCIHEVGVLNNEMILLPSEIPYGIKVTCPRAARDIQRALSKNRVLYPYKAIDKRTSKFTRISWDDALDEISIRLKEVLNKYGPEKVLVLDYAGNMGLITRHFSQRLWYLLRAARTDYSICDSAGELGLKLHYGKTYGALISELYDSKLIVYWGFNPAITSVHNYHIARNRKIRKELSVIVIDPVRTETTKIADIWLRPRFGSDIYLALGAANYIIQKEYYNKEFIEEYTTGFNEFAKWVRKFDLALVSEKTKLRKQEIINFVETYVDLKPNLIFIGYGIQRKRGGINTVRSISLLPALIGEHRGFYYSNSDGLLLDKGLIRGTHLGEPSLIIPQAMISEYLERNKFKFIYIQLVNPLGTHPDPEKILNYFVREDVFVVVHETHWSDTAKHANIVLPATTYLEKDDFITGYWHNYLIWNKKIMEPQGESKNELDVQREIARRLGLDHKAIFEDPLEVIKNSLGESIFNKLMKKGYAEIPYLPKGRYQTYSKKIEFKSQMALELGLEEFPEPIDLFSDGGDLILVFRASFMHTHTQFEEIYGPVPKILYINSKDAEKRNIENGDKVLVVSDNNEVILIAKVTDNVPPGLLVAYKSAISVDGKRINVLIPGRVSNQKEPEINGIRVKVFKA